MVYGLYLWNYKWTCNKVHGLGLSLEQTEGFLISIFNTSLARFVYIGVLKDGLVDILWKVKDTVGDPIFCISTKIPYVRSVGVAL